MGSIVPTKKFFLTLFSFTLLVGVVFGLFRLIKTDPNKDAAQNKTEEQKLNTEPVYAVNTANYNEAGSEIKGTTAVAMVTYINEQKKVNPVAFNVAKKEVTTLAAENIQIVKNKLEADTYTSTDLKTITDDNSPEALKKYGKITAGILLYYGQGQQTSGYLEITKKALETNSEEEFAKLDPFIEFYKKVIGASLAIPIPSSAVDVHLKIVNSYAEIFAILQAFRGTFGDIFSATASLSRLQESSKRFIDAFSEADTFFKQKEIVFLPDESGNLFDIIANQKELPTR